ncbi:hypothetical protein PsorP6_004187 [Peronosclerospora sorghi]|uniref:Uncharacterized protein n=1 Tax=Peronosclerospora sorghi TaxID=230839 RepID=A0ACC0VQT8_9STRA|nr:hypothetical protein PsorP6_004187 [Peronosclerospora sorghi]
MPVERITRYKLLLEELLGCTPPEHIDFLPLQSAIQSFDRVANKIKEISEIHKNTPTLCRRLARSCFYSTLKSFILLTETQEDKVGGTSDIRECIDRNLSGKTRPRRTSLRSELLMDNDDESSSSCELEVALPSKMAGSMFSIAL